MKKKVFSPNFKLGLLGFLALFFVAATLTVSEELNMGYFAKVKRPVVKPVAQQTIPREDDFIKLQSDRVLKYEPGKVLVKWENASKKSNVLSKARSKFKDLETKDIFPVSEKVSKSSEKLRLREKHGLNKFQAVSSSSIKEKVLQIDENKLRKMKDMHFARISEVQREDLSKTHNGNLEKTIVSQFVVDGMLFMMNAAGDIYDVETLELKKSIPGSNLNRLYELDFDVNDTHYPHMWNLNQEPVRYPIKDLNLDGVIDYEWASGESLESGPEAGINAQEGWENYTANDDEWVTVAVIDTGVDFSHDDLYENVWVNSDENNYDELDDDENGYTDDLNGYNFSDLNNDVSDYIGHGTHVAGIIAASQNNSLGVTGVAPNVKIMSLRVFPNSYDDVISEAIHYAADNGAKVMNLSLGRKGDSPEREAAINYAADLKVAVVVSAGNNYSYARYKTPANIKTAITVGAIGSWNNKAYFSNIGVEIDVVAPGQPILSLRGTGTDYYMDLYDQSGHIYENDYYIMSGTSMAAPHIAGVAAMIFARNPDFTVEQVNQALRASTDDLGAEGFDEDYGYGKINLGKAVEVEYMPEAVWYEPKNYDKIRSFSTFSGRVFAEELDSWSVKFKKVDQPDSEWQHIGVSGSDPNQNVDGVLGETWTVFMPDGDVYLKLEVTDKNGLTASDIVQVEVDNVYFTSPDPDHFHVFGKEDIVFEGHVEGMGKGSYELSYQPEICAISDESCWTRIKKLPIRASSGLYEGKLGEWKYRRVLERKGAYRIRLKGNFYQYESVAYMTIVVDDDIKEGWPVKMSRHVIDNGLYAPSLMPTTVGDLDRDGFKEIAVVTMTSHKRLEEYNSGNVFVFDHNGELLPGWPYTYEVEDSWYYLDSQDPVFYDLVGDETKEIFIVSQYKDEFDIPRYIILGFDINGNTLDDHGFPLQLFDDNLLHYGITMSSLIIDDIEEDGSPEFIFHGLSGAFSVIDSDGDFLPGWPKYRTQDWGYGLGFPSGTDVSPSLGDLDRDGFKDIIAPSRTMYEDEHFSRGVLSAYSGRDGSELWQRIFCEKCLFHSAASLADLDQDGNLEILIGDFIGNLYVLNSENGEDIDGWPQYIEGYCWDENSCTDEIWATPAVGNLDDDPELEIVVNNKVGIQVFDHDGRFKWRRDFYIYTSHSNSPDNISISTDEPVITNVDGDIYPDILVGDGFHIYAFDRNGNMIDGWPYKIAGFDSANEDSGIYKLGYETFPKALDIDRDLKQELIISNTWVVDGPDGKDYIIVYDLDSPVIPGLDHWPMFHHDIQHTSRYEEPVEIPETEEARGEEMRGWVKVKIEEWRKRIEDALGGNTLPEDFEGMFEGASEEVLRQRLEKIMNMDGSLSKNDQIIIDEIIMEATSEGMIEKMIKKR